MHLGRRKSSFSSVQSLSHVRLFVTPWTAARQASLSIANSRSLLKLIPIESVMPSSHLILCRPLVLLPSIFLSLKVFSKESVLRIRWPKYRSFSFSISPSNEYSGDGWISLQSKGLSRVFSNSTVQKSLPCDSPKHLAAGGPPPPPPRPSGPQILVPKLGRGPMHSCTSILHPTHPSNRTAFSTCLPSLPAGQPRRLAPTLSCPALQSRRASAPCSSFHSCPAPSFHRQSAPATLLSPSHAPQPQPRPSAPATPLPGPAPKPRRGKPREPRPVNCLP